MYMYMYIYICKSLHLYLYVHIFASLPWYTQYVHIFAPLDCHRLQKTAVDYNTLCIPMLQTF